MSIHRLTLIYFLYLGQNVFTAVLTRLAPTLFKDDWSAGAVGVKTSNNTTGTAHHLSSWDLL